MSSLREWLNGYLSEERDEKALLKELSQHVLNPIVPGNESPPHKLLSFGIGTAEFSNKSGTYRLRAILLAPGTRFTPRQKAYVWLMYARSKSMRACIAGLAKWKTPAVLDILNLDTNDFLEGDGEEAPSGAVLSVSRSRIKRFLRGVAFSPDDARAFYSAMDTEPKDFTPRRMFLYACAHCHGEAHFASLAKLFRKKFGRSDFVDSLGYSPFFYTAFRSDSIFESGKKYREWPPPVRMDDFLSQIEATGARRTRKCRYGFSWEDLECVAADYREDCPFGKVDSWDWSRDGVEDVGRDHIKMTQSVRPKPDPLPSPEEISLLFQSGSDKGMAALHRLPNETVSFEMPFGARDCVMAKAIDDKLVPAKVRAALLLESRSIRELLPSTFLRGKLPCGLLDTRFGREWYCENQMPGFEDIRCSDRFFFQHEAASGWHGRKNALEKIVLKAIDNDSPAQFMMTLTVMGKGLPRNIFHEVLRRGDANIVKALMEQDSGVAALLDLRRLLFYACANWRVGDLVKTVREAEARQPGIAGKCVDALGRNLLWYRMQYYTEPKSADGRSGPAGDDMNVDPFGLLLSFGCDPDLKTRWGVSWRDLEKAQGEIYEAGLPDVGYDLFIDGQPVPREGYRRSVYEWKNGDRVSKVKVVMRATGKGQEWDLPYDCRLESASLAPDRFEIKVADYGRNTVNISFMLWKDGLFHAVS
jgi:hypothetical protein